MGNIVKIIYQKQPKELTITCDGRTLDVSRIADKSLEQWVFPFYSDGEKWNGLYEELKDFVGNENFTIQFDGDDASFEILKYVFQNDPVEVEKVSRPVVTIMYSEDPFDTKITVDGQPFDTTRIQNRSIDEWMNVIDIRGMHWNGIFNELYTYINSETYTIYFVGDQAFMEMMIAKCPSTVSIFYRDPQVAKLSYSTGTTRQNFTQKTARKANNNTNASDADEAVNHYRELFKNIQNETFQGDDSGVPQQGKLSKFQNALLSGGIAAFIIIFVIAANTGGFLQAIILTICSFVGIWLFLYITTIIYTVLSKYERIQEYVKRFTPFVVVVFGQALVYYALDAYAHLDTSNIILRIIVVIYAAVYIGLFIYSIIWMIRFYKTRDAFFRPFFLIYGNSNQGLSDEEYEAWEKDHEARLQEAADKLNEAYTKAKDNITGNNEK